jgi:thiamine biosynthesis lipoprotein
MGTVVSFAVLPAAPARGGPHRRRPDPATAIQAACALLHQADAVFSTRDPQSPLSRLRRGDLAEADGPACLAEVPMACEAAREASGGWFDPWAMPGGYDPTGLVKGWAVARVGRRLLKAGIRHWCINAAGDVLVHGQARPGEGWAVGIADPTHPGRLLDTVTLTAGGVATSGSAERGSHIWDPVSGGPARGIRAATIVGRDLVRADVMATAAVARGAGARPWLETVRGVEGLLVHDDGAVETTSGWPGDGWAL